MTSVTTNRTNKYLTFPLAEEEYGIQISKVKEIIGIMPITKMPNLPAYMEGVINLRDNIIPIVDLRKKFSMPEVEHSQKTCIIVLEVQKKGRKQGQETDAAHDASIIGIIVDGVSEVANIKEEEIEPPPSFSGEINTEFIAGMAKLNGNVKILLDIDKAIIAG